MADDRSKIDEFYKTHYKTDFTKLDEPTRQRLDAALAMLNKAREPALVQNGELVQNPNRAAIMQSGGLSSADASALSLYQNWKMGLTPQLLERDKLKAIGAKDADIDENEAKRKDSWLKEATQQFAWAVKSTDSKAAEKESRSIEMDPIQVTAKVQTVKRDGIDIPLPTDQEKPAFEKWLKKNKVKDPYNEEQHYDYVSAFRGGAGRAPGKEGHFTDQYKLPGHETFSDESQYAVGDNKAKAGKWEGDKYIPASQPVGQPLGQPIGQPLGQPALQPSLAEALAAQQQNAISQNQNVILPPQNQWSKQVKLPDGTWAEMK